MWVHRYIVLFGCSLTLLACSNTNTPRNSVDLNSFGNLLGPTVDGPTYTTSQLQSFAIGSYGVCAGLESGAFGQALCDNNKLGLTSSKDLNTIFHGQINVDNFIESNPLGITSVSSFRIMYNTQGAPYIFGGGAFVPQTVSGAVLLPEVDGKPLPVNELKGVLLFYHQTVTSKGGVPSDFYGNIANPNGPSSALDEEVSSITDMIAASVFATQGYIVVAPDYVGQGIDWQVQHPYVVFPQTNAQSGLNAIKAARNALSLQGVTLPTPTNLYISSYSEGGAYALWTSKLAQTAYAGFMANNGYNLVRTVGVSGAYDLTGATMKSIFANSNNSWESSVNVWNISPGLPESFAIDGFQDSLYPTARALASINAATAKSGFVGYIFASLAYYNSTAAALQILSPKYSAMSSCVNLSSYFNESGGTTSQLSEPCTFSYNLAALYNTPGLDQSQISAQSLASAMASSDFLSGGMTFNDLLKASESGFSNNSIGSFITPGVMTDPTIIPFVTEQNIVSWSTTSPLDLIYLDYDSTLTNINSQEACGLVAGFSTGVKQLSAPGMVNCIAVHNAGQSGTPLLPLFTQSSGIPIFMDHGQAELSLQIFALNQLLANE